MSENKEPEGYNTNICPECGFSRDIPSGYIFFRKDDLLGLMECEEWRCKTCGKVPTWRDWTPFTKPKKTARIIYKNFTLKSGKSQDEYYKALFEMLDNKGYSSFVRFDKDNKIITEKFSDLKKVGNQK